MDLTPQNKKYLIITGIVAIVGGAIYYFSKNSNSGNTGTGIDPTGNGAVIPTVGTAFNAKSIAEDLYTAMSGYGTDEAMITDVLTRVNPTQFEQVFHAFGKRGYNSTTGGIDFLWGQTITKYDLKFWLKNELDDSDYRILKLKYPQYL